MNKSFKLYVAAAACCASMLLVQQWAGGHYEVFQAHWPDFLAFTAAGLLAQAAAMSFGAGRAYSSLVFLPLITCVLLFPPIIAETVALVVMGAMEAKQRLHKPYIALFNVSQTVITVALAAAVAGLVSRENGGRAEILPFAATALVFFVVNIALSSIGIALSQGMNLLAVLRQVVGPGGANLAYDLLASPIALVIAFLYSDHGWVGLVTVIFPLLLIRHSYSSRQKLEAANLDLLKVLVKTIETRDPYTSGHSIRVSELAKAIATDMGLSHRKVEMVGIAGLLHDIGKIDAVYVPVIQKPHDLTDEERALIRTHAARGADLLQSLTLVESAVVQAVRHHHERFDGKGYPDGMTGTSIPLAARIIMLCDSIDAMLSDRPYRKALPLPVVESELHRCSGTQFDPAIVRVVLEKNTLRIAATEAMNSPSAGAGSDPPALKSLPPLQQPVLT